MKWAERLNYLSKLPIGFMGLDYLSDRRHPGESRGDGDVLADDVLVYLLTPSISMVMSTSLPTMPDIGPVAGPTP